MVVNSLSFLFASEIPDLMLEKPETQTHQLVQRRKNYNKSLLSLVEGSGKVQPNKTENFWIISFYSTAASPTPTKISKSLREEPSSPLSSS